MPDPAASSFNPTVVAALVAAAVAVLAWPVNDWLNRRRARELRAERVDDVQRALLAEIRAHVATLENQLPRDDAAREALVAKLAMGDRTPALPHDSNERIFRAIVAEVHILPEWAIDPVVRYYGLLAVQRALAQDIRAHLADHPDNAIGVFLDYLKLSEQVLATGHEAMVILAASLQGGQAAVDALRAAWQAREGARLRQSLPAELAGLRERLSKRSLNPRGR
ncbi:hypothetical protein [Paracoccus alkenifer]|uniref:Uncharacterized protein n=1 Tax=Paracoccus alkenifer TaxID=65735 RepID=A0A1H6JFT6_9RHOB|nr:hypothetical protein [Paracoccus alkenifer]SEH57773.1 hypothetical protein SAMN04488075_0167 [Paracoccus alkenifer]